MEKYQFNVLTWYHLSGSKAKMASCWYKGAGWYYNPVDQEGKVLGARCVAKSEPAYYHAGQFEALNQCGAEGWSVAAFVPTAPEGVVGKVMRGIVGIPPIGPYFILQRRSHT